MKLAGEKKKKKPRPRKAGSLPSSHPSSHLPLARQLLGNPLNHLRSSPQVLGFPGSWSLQWVPKGSGDLDPHSEEWGGSFNPCATVRDLATDPQITIIRQNTEALHPQYSPGSFQSSRIDRDTPRRL